MPFLAPLVGAITTAIGSIGIVGKLALGIGLQLVSAKMEQRRAKKAQQAAAGVQFERQYGENVPRQVACGRVGMAGHDCYVNTYGSANSFYQQVYAFSDFPCDGLSRIWADGKLLVLNDLGGGAYTVAGGDYAGLMSFQFYDGTQTAADASLVANSNPAGRWTVDHVGTGVCYLVASLTYEQNKLNQPPEFFFEIRGARLYDPRKDSTAGGVGPHRWGDYATYAYTECPVVMEYNYRRGFAVNGDMFLGMGMPAADLPVDRYALAANICDETTPDGPRYRCSVIFSADVEHGDNIDAVMQSCGGIVIDSVDGSWPLIGTDQPIVETITDDDLVSGEPVRFQRFRSMADIVNAVQGTYPEPDNLWSPVAYDLQTSTSQVALDRRTRDFKLDFLTVPYKAQANQLASIYYKENRFEATAEIVVRPRFQTIKAGDWIRWNSARYGDRTWMVASRAIKALTSDGPRNVVLSLVERDGVIYDSVGVLPPVIPFPPGQPVYVNALPDYAVIAIVSVGADSRSFPAFRISWSPIADATVSAVEFQWRVASEPTNIYRRTVPASALIAFLQEGVLSLTDYQFRYQLIVEGRVPPPPSAWTNKTSLDGGSSELPVELDRLGRSALDRFEELQAEQNNFWRRIEELSKAFVREGMVGEVQRRQLRAEMGNAFAQIIQESRVRASEDEALAQLYTVLSATVGTNLARLVVEETARATGDSVLASQIVGVSTDFNGRFAQGLMTLQAAANQAGVDARFSIMLRASTAVSFKESGLYLEIYTEGGVQKSRVAIITDQFVVTDGTNTAKPLVFVGGVLKLMNAVIQQAQIENLLVSTSNIAVGAITARETFANDDEIGCATVVSGSWTNVAQVTVNHGAGSPPIIVIGSAEGGGLDGLIQAELIESWTGRVMGRVGKVPLNGVPSSSASYVPISAAINKEPFTLSGVFNPAPTATQSVFIIRARGFDTSAVRNGCINRALAAFYWKR